VIAEGEFYGMQTFDQALYDAIKRGDIAMQHAVRHATHPHDLKLLVAAEGHLHTTMEDVPHCTAAPAAPQASERSTGYASGRQSP
jgi:twitching motility protein PilT